MPRIVQRWRGVYNPAKHRDMMPQRQLFSAAYGCGKTGYLAQSAHIAMQAGTSPDRILGLAIHRPAAQALRDALAHATGCDVPVTTLRRRALTLLQAQPQAALLPVGWDETALLSGIDRRFLIHAAWREAGQQDFSLYQARGQQAGALDWVALLFDRFSDWCGTADPARLPLLEPYVPKLAELWQAYRGYLLLCQRHGVVAFNEILNRASDVLRQPALRQAAQPDLLLLDDLDLFGPAELLFVAQLIGPATSVLATTTTVPSASSPLAIDRLLQRWLTQQQLVSTPGAGSPRQPALIAVEYAGLDDEAHALAQRIAALAANGQPWNDFAIVAFDRQLVPLLQRILPQYGVPVVGEQARDGYTLALAPLSEFGLQLIAGKPLSDSATLRMLRHPALGLSAADARVVSEAVAQQHVQPFADSGNSPHWAEALSPAGRLRLQAIGDATLAARAAGGPPSSQILHWLAELGLDERCWEQTAAALEQWAVELDRRHWFRLLAFLQQSEKLRAALGLPLTTAEAAELWPSAQALVQAEGKPQPQAVRVWLPAELGGCLAPVVFVAGLHEGALPQPAQPLPFADEAALEAAFGRLPGFAAPQSADRAAAWLRGERMLEQAISRASTSVFASYSVADRQGRRRLASPILAARLDTFIDRDGRLHAVPSANPADSHADGQPPEPHQPAAGTGGPEQGLLDVTMPAAETPFVVSPSAIEDYFACPRRCFYARELRLYDVASSPRQTLGQVVHNALNALLVESRHVPLSEQRAVQLVAEHWVADQGRWGSSLKQAVFRQLAEQAAAQFTRFELEHGSAGAAFVGGERAVSWRLPDSDIVITGRVDRIDRTADGLHVVDYKLGRHSPSLNALLAEFVRPAAADEAWRPGDIQLPVYALAVEQGEIDGLERLPGERVASIAQLYPLELYSATGRISAKGLRVIEIVDHTNPCAACDGSAQAGKTANLCREQLAAVVDEVRKVAELMRAGQWQPQPRDGSSTCASCAFRPICVAPL